MFLEKWKERKRQRKDEGRPDGPDKDTGMVGKIQRRRSGDGNPQNSALTPMEGRMPMASSFVSTRCSRVFHRTAPANFLLYTF